MADARGITCAMCAVTGLCRKSLLEHLRGKAHDVKLRQRMRTLAGALHDRGCPACRPASMTLCQCVCREQWPTDLSVREVHGCMRVRGEKRIDG